MLHFGTDGIRKEAALFLVNNFAYKLGVALASLRNPFLIIAQDSRESSEEIKNQVIKGAESVGIKVYAMGLIPTPVLAFLSLEHKTVGVMITASHNPFQDNGIKILLEGRKLSMHQENEVENIIENNLVPPKLHSDHEIDVSLLPYLAKYSQLKIKTDLKIGFDVANGAGSLLVPHIIKRFIKQTQFINYKPDGKNINDHCGSTDLTSIKEFVIKNQLDIGFALDGDADRVLAVDNTGRVYDGDLLIYIVARYLLDHEQLNHHSVVLSIMSNLGIIKALKDVGIHALLTPVGDKYVMEALDENDIVLGGEASGHIINTTLLNSGDGALNAMFIIKIMEETKKSLQDLVKDVVIYPEKLVNLKDVDRKLIERPEFKTKLEKYRRELGENGKVIVRASGTEPLIRISVSASSFKLVDDYIQKIIQDIKG